MEMTGVLAQVIQILVAGISGIAEGIGSGLSTLAQSVFLQMGTDGTIEGLSAFGGVICIFAGIGLAVGLSRMVVSWVQSLGN